MNAIATLRVLWAALMASVGLFAVVILLLPPSGATPDPLHLPLFGGVAASIAIASLLVPRQILSAAVKSAALEIEEVADPDAPSGFAGVKRVAVFKDPAQARRRAFMIYQQYTILGCALSESVALFGVVLSRLGHPPTTGLPFVLFSLLLMALRFPSEEKALALFQSAAKARLT